MSKLQRTARLMAAGVVVAGGALLATAKKGMADTPCDPSEEVWAQGMADVYCNDNAPPYYCGVVQSCSVDDYGVLQARIVCDFYSDDQPCPFNPDKG